MISALKSSFFENFHQIPNLFQNAPQNTSQQNFQNTSQNTSKASQSSQNLQKLTKPIDATKDQSQKEQQEIPTMGRETYGLLSLELMSDDQYRAFQRVTASMSPNEKIAIAQTLTRAGNLEMSVERMQQQEQDKSHPSFLGVSYEGWERVALEFQDNLNNLEGLYSKHYNKQVNSNYNDILRQTQEAKTMRILREFSHAIAIGDLAVDMIG